MSRKKFWLFSAAAAAAIVSNGQAHAQETQDDGDEIIVTATKRETRLQDVAIAVTPVTAELIQNSGIRDLQDLTSVAPALQFNVSENETSATARLRGIGTQGSNPGLESAVGIFIDGVYRARNGVGLSDLGEVSQIEVLRGPQGTLFGRNTSAGLINVRTAAPDLNDFGASAAATYGNYNAMRLEGHVNIPLVEDKLGLRVFAASDVRDGFIDINKFGANPTGAGGAPNRGAGESNDRNMQTIRAQLGFAPTTDFDARLIVDYTERDEQCCAAKIFNPYNLNGARLYNNNDSFAKGTTLQDPFQPQNPPTSTPERAAVVAALGGYGAGGLANVQQGGGEVGQRFGFANRNYDQQLEDKGVSLEMNWDLGAVTLSSVSAYRDWRYNRGQDADFSQADLFYQVNDGLNGFGFKILTQELRAAFQVGPVDSIVGVFYADEELSSGQNTGLGTQISQYFGGIASANAVVSAMVGPLLASPGFAGAALHDAYRQDGKSIALFTHNIWAVDDKTDLTVGLRYTQEEKDLDAKFSQTFNPGTAIATGFANAGALVNAGNPAIPANVFAPYANCTNTAVAGLGALAPAVIGARRIICIAQTRTELAGLKSQSREENEFSGTVAVRREFGDNTSGYASVSHGYKGGGFNLDRSYDFTLVGGAYNTGFAPEFVDAYEIGLKNRLFDNALILNLATFWNKYENFQLNTFNGVSFQVSSIPEVTSQGVEVDAIWNTPVDGLDFQGGLAYTEAEYGDDTGWVARSANPLDPSKRPVNFRLPGSRLTNAPLWTATGAFTYEKPIFNSGFTGVAYVDFRYVSEQTTGANLDASKIQPEYVMFNGRLALKTPGEHWALELWGRNLTDQEVQQIAFDVPLQENARGAFLGDPRTYGVTLRFDY